MNPTGTNAMAAPSGLKPEHKMALSQAAGMIAQGHTNEAAVAHLMSNGMPRIVARVLVKQYERVAS